MSARKSIYMATTEISAERTALEIQGALVQAGARHIQMDYNPAGKITSMNFVLMIGGLPYPFKLPARVEALQRIMKDRRIRTQGVYGAKLFEARDNEQAERIAWRQLLLWIKAQLAMIETGMVQPQEVFCPYLVDDGGTTLFEHLSATRFRALPAPEART